MNGVGNTWSFVCGLFHSAHARVHAVAWGSASPFHDIPPCGRPTLCLSSPPSVTRGLSARRGDCERGCPPLCPCFSLPWTPRCGIAGCAGLPGSSARTPSRRPGRVQPLRTWRLCAKPLRGLHSPRPRRWGQGVPGVEEPRLRPRVWEVPLLVPLCVLRLGDTHGAF